MLNYLKNVIFFLVFLLFIGCSTTQKITLISSAGEIIPDPYYTASPVGKKMKFIWYYERTIGMKDLDKSVQPIPVFLNVKQNQSISRKKTLDLQMVLRVFNPSHNPYIIFMNRKIEYLDGNIITRRYIEGQSYLDYRQWEFPYPYDERIKKVTSFIEILYNENLLLRTRKFQYIIE